VPFLILALCYWLSFKYIKTEIIDKGVKKEKREITLWETPRFASYIIVGIVLALFMVVYLNMTGIEITNEHSNFLANLYSALFSI